MDPMTWASVPKCLKGILRRRAAGGDRMGGGQAGDVASVLEACGVCGDDSNPQPPCACGCLHRLRSSAAAWRVGAQGSI